MKLTLTDNQLRQQVRYFAYYQLLTGLFMLGFILLMMTKLGHLVTLYVLYFGSACLAGFLIYCGYLTLKQPRRGLLLSRYHLLAQFLGFAAGGFAFRFFAGPFIVLSLDLSGDSLVSVSAGIGDFSFSINSGDATVISINLVALLLFLRTTQWLNEWDYRYPAVTEGQA